MIILNFNCYINDFSAKKTLTQPTWIKYQYDDLDAAKAEINNTDAWYKSENGERICGFIYDGQLFLKLHGSRPVGSAVTSYACLMFYTT